MNNIVIVGAGFGGLRAALKLNKYFKNNSDYKIILIDKNSYQTYTPSLYEIATAYRGKGLRRTATEVEFKQQLGGSCCFSIKDIIEGTNIQFVQDEVTGIKPAIGSIFTKTGDAIQYKHLIIATGSCPTYYNIEGAETNTYPLVTMENALEMRHCIKEELSKAAKQNKEVCFTTIGGGLSGFELTTEMAFYISHLLKEYHPNFSRDKIKIKILDADPQILSTLPASMRRAAKKRLKHLGIKTQTNTLVTKVEQNLIHTKDGAKIKCDFIMWGGGIQGIGLCQVIEGLKLHKSARILVNTKLQAQGKENIFAIGDSAYLEYKGDKPVPATAWVAEQQADIAAKNIYNSIKGKPLINFKLKMPGFVSSAGGKYAIANIYGITFSGFFAWSIKRFIDLKYLLSIYPYRPWRGLSIWVRELDLWTRND